MTIYKITNTVNGKVYVGQTVQKLRMRWALHKHQSLNRNRPLYRAMRKYGISKFIIEELEVFPTGTNKERFDVREVFWIKELNSMAPNGYNLTSGGNGKFFLSKETKARISQSKVGIPRSPETVEKMRRAALGNTNRRGAILSESTRAKISQSQIGRKDSDETKNKKRLAHIGERAYNSKKVQCVQTGIVYPSTGDAARSLGLQQTSISAVCLGKRKSTGKLTFKFI